MSGCGRTSRPSRCGASYGRAHVSSGGGHRAAMLEVAPLMLQEEIDNAPPKPRGSVERFRTVVPQFLTPIPSLVGLHLAPMRLAHDRRQIACNMGGLSAVKRVYFDLEILR